MRTATDVQNGTELGICNEGYEGILCAKCQEGWGTSGSYGCIKCQKTGWFFVELIALGVAKFALMGYTVNQAREGKNNNRDKSSTLRILINYFQTLSILSVIPLQWPQFVETLRSYSASLFSGNSGGSGSFSYECVFYWLGFDLNSITYYEWNAIYSFLSPFYWTILIGSLILLKIFIKNKTISKSELNESLLITFIVSFFYIWPNTMTVAMSLFNCIDVGRNPGEVVVLHPDPTLTCYSRKHWTLLAVSGLPTLLLWGLVLPTIYFIQIKNTRQRNMLGDESFTKKYGFMYQGYTRNYYWWEFVILSRKLVLLLASVLLVQNIVVMSIALALTTFIFTLLQLKGTPYNNSTLNSLELTSLLSLGAILYASLFQLNLTSETWTLILTIVAITFTLLFLARWTGYYFIFLRQTIQSIWSLIKPKLEKLGRLVGLIKKPNENAAQDSDDDEVNNDDNHNEEEEDDDNNDNSDNENAILDRRISQVN